MWIQFESNFFQARKDDAERKRLDALAKKKEREELAAAEDAAVTTQLNKKTGVGLVNNSFLPAAQRIVVCFFAA